MDGVSEKMQLLAKTLVILLLAGVAIFFRTEPLRLSEDVGAGAIELRAEAHVKELMRSQILRVVESQAPHLEAEQKKMMVEHRIEQIITKDRRQFQNQVEEVRKKMTEARGHYYSSKYLSGADSYYYLSLSQKIADTGSLGMRGAGGTFFNPLRYAPFGHWDTWTLHPFLGYWTYQLLQLWQSEMGLMQGVAYYPLLLTFLIIIAFLWFSLHLHQGFFATSLGLLCLILSPIVVQRSTYGWYDTDPYNIIFPILILGAFFAWIRSQRHLILWAVLAGAATGLYGLFWKGWSFIFPLMLIAQFAVVVLEWIEKKQIGLNQPLLFLLVYFVSSMAGAMLFLSPAGALDSIKTALIFLPQAAGSAGSLWPNLFVLIGETNPVDLAKWFYMVTHYYLAIFLILGIVSGIDFWRSGQKQSFKQWLAALFLLFPLLLLSFKSERYTLLVVFPVSLMVLWGVRYAFHLLCRAMELLSPFIAKLQSTLWRQGIAAAVIVLLAVPRTVFGAEVAGKISHVIMNDVWYESLETLKKDSPENSIVFGWWSPGYFINAIAGRRVPVDGGTQSQADIHYWIAKALMEESETKALGIFRMLATSGNKAVKDLESRGWSTAASVALVDRLVALKRQEASSQLPQEWSELEKQRFLDLLFPPAGPPPAYVMLYDDLVEKNLMLQMFANWDFEKAKAIREQSAKTAEVGGLFSAGSSNNYGAKVLQIAGTPLPFEKPQPVVRQTPERLIFANQAVFDVKKQQVYLPLNKKRSKDFEPVHTFFFDGDQWKEKGADAPVPLSAIVYPLGNSFRIVVTHRALADSLLLRIFYMNGYGLEQFEPVVETEEQTPKIKLAIYKIRWPS